MKILLALFPILLALGIGYFLGKILPVKISNILIKSISPLVLLMLFLIGFEFGEILFSAEKIIKVLKDAITFSILTTFFSLVLLVTFLKESKGKTVNKKFELKYALPALKEAIIALSMVLIGASLFILSTYFEYEMTLIKTADLLLLLVLLVGIDFAYVKLNKKWFSFNILIVPFLVIIGSLLAAFPASFITNEQLSSSLAISSGLGWFSLSSVLIGDAYGNEYGTIALLTDLFRELIAILILYVMGEKHPKASIGSAGATAMDSTLPIIKQTCSNEHIPLAIVSGFILTALAPLLITIFL